MKRWTEVMVAIVCLAAVPAVHADDRGDPYGLELRLSSSATDPFENTGPLQAGAFSLYLWFHQTCDYQMAGMTAGISTPPGTVNLGFTSMNGFLNVGDDENLWIAAPCPFGPVVMGAWTFLCTQEGSFCLGDSENFPLEVGVCAGAPKVLVPYQTGFGVGGAPTCDDNFSCPVPVEAARWGAVKSLYR